MLHLLFTIVLIVLLCWLAVWVLGQLAPGHPGIIDNIIWVVCVLLVILILAGAFGVADVPVPRLR
jgi:hypothetical protein